MNPSLEGLSQETIDRFVKAATSGILATTGVYGVDLNSLVSLVPVNVPARNNTAAFPRTIASEGDDYARWRALLNVNSQQSNPAVGFDYAGPLAKVDLQNCFAPYNVLAFGGTVSLDAVSLARGFADALATDELQTMIQLFIGQDIYIINGQNWPLGTTTEPTPATATTGGSIAADTEVYVACAARSGVNYFYGGSAEISAVASIETGSGSTNVVTASLAAMEAAVAYDWFVGASSGTLYYYTTTTVAAVTITSIPGANQAVPSLPLISSVVPTAANAATDTSYSANYYNGVIASSLGWYGTNGPVAPGSGGATTTGATFIDNGGNALTASGSSIPVLDNLFEDIWASAQLSPTAIMVNSLQAKEIVNLLLGTSAALTLLPPTDAAARTNLVGGGYVGTYINAAAAGVQVPIEVHPHLAPGTIIARTDRVPFPGSNIGSVFEVRCQYDTMRFDYGANRVPNTDNGGPRFDYEIRSNETLVNRAPGVQGIVSNVG